MYSEEQTQQITNIYMNQEQYTTLNEKGLKTEDEEYHTSKTRMSKRMKMLKACD